MLSKKEVALKLVEIEAIKLSPSQPFRWASGRLSPIYCDNRTILSFPKVRKRIKDSLICLAQEHYDFDVVAGVATAGIPHGALIADALELPFVYVRSSSKAHGTRSQIEGVMPTGSRCLVVEDLISTGGSSIKAVNCLRDHGSRVVGVIAIFSYAFEKAQSAFDHADCSFHTLSDYHALISTMEDSGLYTPEQLESLRHWRQNPVLWSDQFSK